MVSHLGAALGGRSHMEALRLQEGDHRLALDPQAWWQLCTWPSMPQDQEVKVIADCREDVRWAVVTLAQLGEGEGFHRPNVCNRWISR